MDGKLNFKHLEINLNERMDADGIVEEEFVSVVRQLEAEGKL
jgi:hypothetical protein